MTPEALQRFCGTENDVRYYLQAPWREPGTIVASNGHICIEIPDDGRELKSLKPKGRPPEIGKLLTTKPPIGAFGPMPALVPAKVSGICQVCKGKGTHGEIECDECDARGDFDHGSHTYTCLNCCGTGHIGSDDKQVTCLACDGLGEPLSPVTHKTKVGNATFATRYLRLFSSLPGVEISTGGAEDMMHIRFDGGRGAVMPIRP